MLTSLRYIAYLLLGYYAFAMQNSHADVIVEIYGKSYITKAVPVVPAETVNKASDEDEATDDDSDDSDTEENTDDSQNDAADSDTAKEEPAKKAASSKDKKAAKEEPSLFGRLLGNSKK